MSLVITGNPGVGKHTVSKILAKKLNYKILDINKIALKSVNVKKSSGAVDIDTRKLKSVIKKILTKKSLVVGHLAPYVLTKSQVKAVIVLRKNPYNLISVYKKRKYTHPTALQSLVTIFLRTPPVIPIRD
jgi:adenylate kinase